MKNTVERSGPYNPVMPIIAKKNSVADKKKKKKKKEWTDGHFV